MVRTAAQKRGAVLVLPPDQPRAAGRALCVDASAPVLVGREVELRDLVDAVAQPPAVVFLRGEPGIGKSRLVAELLDHPELANRQRLIGHCHQLSEPSPLGPVIDALRAARLAPHARLGPVTGALRGLLPELIEDLPPAPPPLDDPRAERQRTARAIVELLHACPPTLLVLEDLHWADEVTADLLRILVPDVPSHLTMLLTFRQEELPATSPLPGLLARRPRQARGRDIALEGLTPGQTGALVSAILGEAGVSQEFADYLHERTAGIPFAVEEVVGLLRDRRDIIRRGDRWARVALDELQVPPAVRDTVLARLRHLPADARRVVHAAAVIGVPADEQALAGLAGLAADMAIEALSSAIAAGLLWEDEEGIGFRHALARDAIYQALPGPVRRAMHLSVALSLETATPKPVTVLAFHFRKAGRTSAWLRYAEEAADAAVARGEDATAANLLMDAMSVELDAETAARLGVKLGRAAMHGAAHEDATRVIQEVLARRVLAHHRRGELRFLLGLLLDGCGRSDEAIAEIRASLDDLHDQPEIAAAAMAALGVPWRTDATPLEVHLDWLDRAWAACRGHDDQPHRLRVLVDRAAILTSVGDRRGREAVGELPDEPASLRARRELARGCNNLAQACFYLGRYGDAESFLQRGMRHASASSYVRQADGLATDRLLLDWVSGRWDGLAERAEQIAQETVDVPPTWIDAELVHALLLLDTGQLAEAERRLNAVVDAAWRMDAVPAAGLAGGALARIALARGEPGVAIGHTRRHLDIIAKKGIWVWAAESAAVTVAALLAGARDDQARQLVAAFSAGIAERDAPAAGASLARCRALLAEADGQLQMACENLEVAERLWEQMPRPLERARAAQERGRVLSLLPDKGAADAVLRDALRMFESLGARWEVSRTQQLMRAAGTAPRHRRGRRGYGDALSPREMEVARLAGDHTNQEIAEQLFLSVKTVESHISSVMRKLDLSSRKAFAHALSQDAAE
jgi:DNA-binding CsgD family transcriptional regulator